jgi:hypothetical protein
MDIDRYREDDFNSYLQTIVRLGGIEASALGITKLVLSQGVEGLSSKQSFVFERDVIDPYYVEKCKFCGTEIPWCEMLEATDNGGYCGWCAHRDSKDD